MKALQYDTFGSAEVFHFADAPAPVAGAGEVVVGVLARSINLIDIRVRSGMMGPLVDKRFPKIPGADFAGTVVAIGSNVSDLAVGDRVFGAASPFKGGAFAEQIAVPSPQVAPVPSGMTSTDAAAIPIAGLAALQSLRDLAALKSGHRVLIHGATGPVGVFAVQIAKLLGAHVTAVGGAGLATAKALGADVLIDYRSDVQGLVGSKFDAILNASGKLPFALGKKLLTPRGRLIEPSPTIPVFIGSKIGNLFRSRKHQVLAAQVGRSDLMWLARMVSEGKLKPVIAATYPFADSLQALAAVDRGGVVGKVVVTS